ncbi:copper amine oxidase N-terminal domain-containing protein [Herbivorax sp. ANBcel31]|uniref:copper amine oxidase N-terminal domain-containing protein n=1 Tax=Herbivorax sp. ANBcel31 TaxID=3069754 RepID=UPI0027B66715|nr:copper amine oxidase N-terminal domain-containing protein [Herbivorax sp. ANBcel31]MDQ2088064.1 copper amine oxidase N-terminal domain-containing protein [Herbivorax sp. ANBcel31]
MKKFSISISTILMVSLLLTFSVDASEERVTVQKDDNIIEDSMILHTQLSRSLLNEELVYIDTLNEGLTPTIENGRTLVPVRFVAEGFGLDVGWDHETRTVYLESEDREIILKIGEDIININRVPFEMDVSAKIIEDRTFIPLRAVSEALKKEVFYKEGIIIIGEDEINDISDEMIIHLEKILRKEIEYVSEKDVKTEEDSKEDSEQEVEQDNEKYSVEIERQNIKKSTKEEKDQSEIDFLKELLKVKTRLDKQSYLEMHIEEVQEDIFTDLFEYIEEDEIGFVLHEDYFKLIDSSKDDGTYTYEYLYFVVSSKKVEYDNPFELGREKGFLFKKTTTIKWTENGWKAVFDENNFSNNLYDIERFLSTSEIAWAQNKVFGEVLIDGYSEEEIKLPLYNKYDVPKLSSMIYSYPKSFNYYAGGLGVRVDTDFLVVSKLVIDKMNNVSVPFNYGDALKIILNKCNDDIAFIKISEEQPVKNVSVTYAEVGDKIGIIQEAFLRDTSIVIDGIIEDVEKKDGKKYYKISSEMWTRETGTRLYKTSGIVLNSEGEWLGIIIDYCKEADLMTVASSEDIISALNDKENQISYEIPLEGKEYEKMLPEDIREPLKNEAIDVYKELLKYFNERDAKKYVSLFTSVDYTEEFVEENLEEFLKEYIEDYSGENLEEFLKEHLEEYSGENLQEYLQEEYFKTVADPLEIKIIPADDYILSFVSICEELMTLECKSYWVSENETYFNKGSRWLLVNEEMQLEKEDGKWKISAINELALKELTEEEFKKTQ